MKLLAALFVLIACLASIISSTPIREKRQWGPAPPPFNYGHSPFYDYGGYGPGGYYGYGPRPYWRWRRPTVIEKTVIYRPG
ncbi:hypothetical protein Aduo_018012 [Ancylostoma duodenale]